MLKLGAGGGATYSSLIHVLRHLAPLQVASQNSQAVLISYFIAILRSVSCRAACIVREGEGLLNYNRSCWAIARTLMKDARRGLIR